MEWFEKFKVGQRVRVVKKVSVWQLDGWGGHGLVGGRASWVRDMDKTIGKIYSIVQIDSDVGYRLETDKISSYQYNHWYPMESLRGLVGEQLQFNFMRQRE